MPSVKITANQQRLLDMPVGIPPWLNLTNLPARTRGTLQRLRFAGPNQLDWLDGQTSEVRNAGGEIVARYRRLRNGQSMEWLRKKEEKRSPQTNRAMNARRPTSKDPVVWTPLDVNDSVDEQIDLGLRYVAVVHKSKIGMYSVSMAPECMAHYLRTAIRLQRHLELNGASGENPKEVPIHHVHVLAPWLNDDWFDGEPTALYTRGDDLSVSVNCGAGYPGLVKKPFLAAHMWWGMYRGFGFLHAGVCKLKDGRIALASAASAFGKSELSQILTMLKKPGNLEFVGQDGSVYVAVPDETGGLRYLVVDDIVAYKIVDGEMHVVDLETGHYYRIDRLQKPGDIPFIEALAAPDSTTPCVWSNVHFDETSGTVVPQKHVTLEGTPTDNPRVIVETSALSPDSYVPTTWDTPAKVDYFIAGIPAAKGLYAPAFSVIARPTWIALMLAGLRANKGNQSINQVGMNDWIDEGAMTLVPFSPMTEGEVAGQAMLLRNLSNIKNMYFLVNTRFNTAFEQGNKYDALWLLRYCLEHGVDFRKLRLTPHKTRFWGFIPELPPELGIDQRLLDPSLCFDEATVLRSARAFESSVLARLSRIENEATFPYQHRRFLHALRLGTLDQSLFSDVRSEALAP